MKRKRFAASLERQKKVEKPETEASQETVAVTLLLAGGHEYQITVLPTDPLLQELYETLMATAANPVMRLFQIPINNGKAALVFPSDRLVGLTTEPPLIVEQPLQPASSFATPTATAPKLDSEYLQFDQFLTATEHQQLLDYVWQRQPDFVPTSTFTGEVNYRESVVLYDFPDFADLIARRIQAQLPQIWQKLSIPPFTVTQIEAQLTAHNDGQFYKVHNDNGSPDTATRELTYVYYFYRDPKPFTGGELVIYDSKIQNNYYVQADTFKTVEPRNNSIVFFFSRYMHEVLPIRCPSRDFADSRFTINGWIRR
jgi:Rps23 Pro-64 3,4-dihydroxylase Tpa1-like proline 4-hydroxylase